MVMSDENGGCIFVSVGDGSYSCGQLGREADDDDMAPDIKIKICLGTRRINIEL